MTTVIWFAAFRNLESKRGAFVTAVKTGAQQAGAVFVIHNHLDQTATLYGPAPQAIFDQPQSGRQFEKVLDKCPQSEIDVYLEKQVAFDPDLWIIETESGEGSPNLDL
ncbi:MAG: DUF1491 family protein [Pseudomonadota bacterium]